MAKREGLQLTVTDIPKPSALMLFGFQQAMLCISGLLVYPCLISELVCAGDQTIALRVQLISATFVACGLATIAQTSFGLRLCILHGPAIAFLPPLLAYKSLNDCEYSQNDRVEKEIWMNRIQEISGSLMLACISFVIIGGSGLAGILSRLIGPITITPLMLLLTISIVPTMEEKLSLHWVSILMLLSVGIMAVYLENARVPIPFTRDQKKGSMRKIRLFGQFPYLLSMLLVWFVCFVMTVTNIEPIEGEARTDKNATVLVFSQSRWFQIPYPGEFGLPRVSVGLCLGYLASCFASVIENLGSYDLLARVSEQRSPPKHAVNRAIMVEGCGSILAASMGVGTGVTTYSENIALIHITRVASRRTMQVAGGILVFLGLFTKCAAILASIPDALVGGILTMGISMIAGVTMSNLQLIDLKLTRNLSIMGLSLMLGLIIPRHLERKPIDTGNPDWNQVLNMLLSIKMLVGGVIAAFLDNTVPGATLRQRGLHKSMNNDLSNFTKEKDGYSLPEWADRLLSRFPVLTYLPFLPNKDEIKRFDSTSCGSLASSAAV